MIVDAFNRHLAMHRAEIGDVSDLSDYIALSKELVELRRQDQGGFEVQTFALQVAVMMALQDYEKLIGMPLTIMPPQGSDERTEAQRIAPWEWQDFHGRNLLRAHQINSMHWRLPISEFAPWQAQITKQDFIEEGKTCLDY